MFIHIHSWSRFLTRVKARSETSSLSCSDVDNSDPACDQNWIALVESPLLWWKVLANDWSITDEVRWFPSWKPSIINENDRFWLYIIFKFYNTTIFIFIQTIIAISYIDVTYTRVPQCHNVFGLSNALISTNSQVTLLTNAQINSHLFLLCIYPEVFGFCSYHACCFLTWIEML